MYGFKHPTESRTTYSKSKLNKSDSSHQSSKMSYKTNPSNGSISLNRIPEKPMITKVNNKKRSLNHKFKTGSRYRNSEYYVPFTNTRPLKFPSDDKFKHIKTKSKADKNMSNVETDDYALVRS
jgi:hypothetical protein